MGMTPVFRLKVYPRVCGGTALMRAQSTQTCGLSPRVRGNLPVGSVFAGFDGSIPACAGEPRGMAAR